MTDPTPLTAAERATCRKAGDQLRTRSLDRVSCDDATKELLWRSWQEGLAAGRTGSRRAAVRALVADGERDLATLTASLYGLVKTIGVNLAQSRWGGNAAAADVDDAIGDAAADLVEALHRYDPAQGSTVARWCAAYLRRRGQERDHLAGGGVRPAAWRRVAAVAAGVASDSGITDGEQLRAAVAGTFADKERSSVKRRNPGWDDAQVAAAVHERLSKDSVNAALKHFTQIVTTGEAPLRLDAPVGDRGAAASDYTPDVADGIGDAGIVAELVGGAADYDLWRARHDDPPATLADLAGRIGGTVADVRARLARVSGRVTAPHAHWACLAPGVDTQVVWDTVGAVGTAGGSAAPVAALAASR